MFKSARLKLTAWYLVIIMAISLTFSAAIYQSVAFEFQRRLNMIERRLELEEMGLRAPPGPHHPFDEDLETAKNRVLLILAYANGAILIFSGAAGYFLAGKTLKPIEKTLEEQKRFVADASHELRTPLTALKASIEVALRDKKPTTKELKNVLKSNLEEINNLQSLTDDLLRLAQFQKENHNLASENVDIKEVVDKAYKKIRPLAKKKDIELKIEAEKALVKADEDGLTKMVTIFLDNAIKYTPEGGKISVTARPEGKWVAISIKDSGIGIAKKHLPHIFDRFYRADASRSKKETDGFGLGLAVAKGIIEQHKGKVDVESEVGKGTTFTIKLPLTHS